MTSLAAKAVAEEVIETIRKGKKPSVRQIAPKHGYTLETADSGQIQQTQSFRSVIDPFVDRLKVHREKILVAMESKDLTKEQYKVLSESMGKVNHDLQLFTGGATENIAVKPIYGGLSRYSGDQKDIQPS